jgi:hypothetical protein
MGSIAATLLCYMDPKRVYPALVHLHDSYTMHNIFKPGFPGLLEAIYIQERITEQMMPGVYEAFKHQMISTTSYATKWYITLFANSVPFHTQLRLWDAFFLDGPDIFIVVAVAIVWVHKGKLVNLSPGRSGGAPSNRGSNRLHHVEIGNIRDDLVPTFFILCPRG